MEEVIKIESNLLNRLQLMAETKSLTLDVVINEALIRHVALHSLPSKYQERINTTLLSTIIPILSSASYKRLLDCSTELQKTHGKKQSSGKKRVLKRKKI